jgi:hypothetical protein
MAMRNLLRSIVLILVLAPTLLAAGPQTPQTAKADPQRELLDRFTGHWVLRGVIAKKQTTHDVDVEWVLNKEYLRMHEVSREKDAAGTPLYEAIVYLVWEPKAGEYACLWLDTTGISLFAPEGVGRATPAPDRIPFFFKDADGGVRTTFIYDRAKNSWSWTIDNESKGVASPFARVTLTRK